MKLFKKYAILFSLGLLSLNPAHATDFEEWWAARPTATAPYSATDYFLLLQGGAAHKVLGNTIATLSGTQTLTNKTITGGTLGGTFGGSPTFSGAPKLTGIPAGTQISCLGLDSGNNVVKVTEACDNRSPSPNIVYNSAMMIDQLKEGGTTTITGGYLYCVDGFKVRILATNGQTATCNKTSNKLLNSVNSLLITVTASGASAAGDLLEIKQSIEAKTLAGIGFGTSSAKSLTVSYTVKSSINGNFGVRLLNGATNTRYYRHMCTFVAATASRCSVTIPGDTTGTWVLNDNTEGMTLQWVLMAGSNFNTGTLDVWSTSSQQTGSTQTNLTETNGATFEITNVKLEVSDKETPYVVEPPVVALARAQRYYAKTFQQGTAPASSAGLLGAVCDLARTSSSLASVNWRFPVEMRASPTVTSFNPSAAGTAWRNVTQSTNLTASIDPSTAKGANGVQVVSTAAMTAANDNACIHLVADARL